MVHLLGDAVPLDYEVEEGGGVVVLRLREGQLRRLKEADLPKVDRPLRFSVMRGAKPALHGQDAGRTARGDPDRAAGAEGPAHGVPGPASTVVVEVAEGPGRPRAGRGGKRGR